MDQENEQDKQTPTQQLAEEIATALVDAGLIEDKRREELLKKIVSGNVKPDDWALWVDTAVEAADREAQNGR
jgi:L-asparaginase/Glu-tRNA(Gln) amidotransferase subunit D